MEMETETLDKIYLEWSQFTNARTNRELKLIDALNQIQRQANKNWGRDEAVYVNQVVNHALSKRRQT